MRFPSDEEGVTPVVGTVIVLAVTMLGIGVVLAWGVPAIQVIQDQTALTSMESEFSNLRFEASNLRIVEDARAAAINLPGGTLSTQPGTTFFVYGMYRDTPNQVVPPQAKAWGLYRDCEAEIGDWNPDDGTLLIVHKDCRKSQGAATFDIVLEEISSGVPVEYGNLPIAKGADETLIVPTSPVNFGEGQWQVRMLDADGNEKFAVWIINSDQLRWDLESSSGKTSLILENGALFSQRNGITYLEAPPELRENDGLDIPGYGLRLIAYSGDSISYGGPDTVQFYLQLDSSEVRANHQRAVGLRYEFVGELAEAWCNIILSREVDPAIGAYSEDPAATCAEGDASLRHGVKYTPATPFNFAFVHGTVNVEATA